MAAYCAARRVCPCRENHDYGCVVAQAGFKDFAKQKKIELRRDNGKEKFLFNYPDFIKGKNMDKNINRELQDGDEIIVPE